MALKFSKGNRLLNEAIIDFYLPNVSCRTNTCVGATTLCAKYCYGNGVFRHPKKDDGKILLTEMIAEENYRCTLKDSFVENMSELINATLSQRADIPRIRIHSIGDFYSYEYFLKWIEIIKKFESVQFTAYVKNFEVLERYKRDSGQVPSNFNLLLSVYPDTYDKYSAKGGEKYVDQLLEELQEYYNAKKYIVCSREFFLHEINQKNTDKFFCNSGTDILCKQYNLDEKQYSELFKTKQNCSECLKCYSHEKCPAGSSIYALLRSSSKLANLHSER